MKADEIMELFRQFESIANDYEGVECWSARELSKLLGYTQWRNFENIVEKAKAACRNAGQNVSYHFADVSKMIDLPKSAQREVDDFVLTRYACYLIAQNGDARKPQVRVQARNKLAETEKRMSGILYERGVDSRGFSIIRSKGDKALFKLDTALLKRKLGAPANRPLADFLPTVSIKAKDLAAEMTSVNVQQKELYGHKDICDEHVDNNTAVRKMLLRRGIVPESLPAGEDVRKVEKRLKSDEKKIKVDKNDTITKK